MEKLSTAQQTQVKKMASERIKEKLIAAGQDPEKVKAMSREQLLAGMAHLLAVTVLDPEMVVPPEVGIQGAMGGPAPATATVGPPSGMSMEQLKMWIDWERERAQKEELKEKARLDLEREKSQREAEDRKARMEMEERLQNERLQKESDRHAEAIAREAEDRKARMEMEERLQNERLQRESDMHAETIALQQAQLNAAVDKSRIESERNASLTNKIKQTMLALKDVVGMFPNDPVEITAYFEGLEKTFETFKVANELRSHVLRSKLHEKAKSLVARLPRDVLDNYMELKAFLLKEYQISPLRLKEKFYSLTKVSEESYTMLATKLRNLWTYYLNSRGGIDSEAKVISLMCADRLKELLPKSCLDFVLMQEKSGSWLDEKELAILADDYMSCHYRDGNPRVGPSVSTTSKPFKGKFNAKQNPC
jgi:hypothetical protein